MISTPEKHARLDRAVAARREFEALKNLKWSRKRTIADIDRSLRNRLIVKELNK